MRWIKQRTRASCAVIALLNVRKAMGYRVSYARDFYYWRKRLKQGPNGTCTIRMLSALNSFGHAKLLHLSIASLRHTLKRRIPCALYYQVAKRHTHVMAIVAYNKGKYLCINDGYYKTGHTAIWRSEKTIKKYLRLIKMNGPLLVGIGRR